MSQPAKAVFLSYASQDADAAKRIAESLRSSGVEVWFDQEGGLEHGDEWDQKIRRQIKECVLFIAVISANTQAREEGYFRIEWELAAQRALGIASGVAFILPVIIDGTREPEALVPDRFRAVQWTKLPGGVVPPEVQARFLKLWSHRAGVLKHQSGEQGAGRKESGAGASFDDARSEANDGRRPATPLRKPKPVWLWIVLALIAGLGAWFIFKPRRSPEEVAKIVASAQALAENATAKAQAQTVSDWPRDPVLKRARQLIYGLEGIPDDFALADDIVKPLLAARPNDPDVVTMAAEISEEFVARGFDTSDARRALAQRLTERAVTLAPENPVALAALARYLLFVNSQLPRAEALARQATELAPNEPRYYRMLYSILAITKQGPAADACGKRMVAQFPHDALVHYDIARRYKDENNIVAMEEWIDRTLALSPLPAALVWKAWLLLDVHGDVAGMRATLDRIPERQRVVPRVVAAFAVNAGLTEDTAKAAQLLNALGDTWLADFDFTGPKALLIGDLLRVDGREDLARLQYESALAEILRAEVVEPTNLRLRRAEMLAQLALGHQEKASAAMHLVAQSLRLDGGWNINNSWWNGVIRAALLLGEHDQALALLKDAATTPTGRLLLRNQFNLDPRMKPFHEDPAILALLAEPVERKPEDRDQKSKVSAPIDQKSVAVLAFANLSDDKGNEYFSDGISEELLTVLQKIPGLHVAARTSAFSFKGKNATAQEIGEKLGVATLVDGSVRKSGSSVRITARLSRAATGEQLWSESYTRDLKDVFAVQSELAETIVGQLRGQLGAAAAKAEIQAQVSAAEKGGTKNLEAHELYLQGKYFLNRATLEDTARATALLQRAVELDPSFALAWAALSGAGWFRGGYGLNRQDFDEGFALARRAADQAVAIEPALAAGHIARFDVQSAIDFDWKGAKESLRRARALTPGDVAVIFRSAEMAYSFGQMERAVELIRQTVALDPVNPLVYTNEGYILLALHRFDEAVAAFRRVQELSPASPWGHAGVAMALVASGRSEAAAIEAARESNEWSRLYALSLARWGQKDHPAADKVLAEFIAGNADVAAYQIACVYAYRGETDRAFEWLERAYRQRDPGLGWGCEDYFLQGLHADPRWPVFLKKLGVAGEQLP